MKAPFRARSAQVDSCRTQTALRHASPTTSTGFPLAQSFHSSCVLCTSHSGFPVSPRSQVSRPGLIQGLAVPMDHRSKKHKTSPLRTKHPKRAPRGRNPETPLTYFKRRMPVLAKETNLRLQHGKKQQAERPASFLWHMLGNPENGREASLLADMLEAVLAVQEELKNLEVRRDGTSEAACIDAASRCLSVDNELVKLGKGGLTEKDRAVIEFCKLVYNVERQSEGSGTRQGV
ncbi:uncharacterized protein BDZ99DRAFT_36191 [Mytilinidion resinicola]|uniref:Uncharacterized protein n=1 Tax=Mytilinidion resinicola TaxID=574789 RepID=A0A6A6YLW6_9PEZI|nr:uncharacterized protein BDZ99DRAFT_36191 [Mytilinidion resinicola]KAF2809771.1 hypothetical protein BDZ99DRAFT_36191 [Mytilinidion resinicola]